MDHPQRVFDPFQDLLPRGRGITIGGFQFIGSKWDGRNQSHAKNRKKLNAALMGESHSLRTSKSLGRTPSHSMRSFLLLKELKVGLSAAGAPARLQT